MAVPTFKPSGFGAIGTTYTDPQSGTIYRYSGYSWVPVGSTTPAAQTPQQYNVVPEPQPSSGYVSPTTQTITAAEGPKTLTQEDIQNAINDALAKVQKPQPINIDPSKFVIPDFNSFVTAAYNDPKVVAYYKSKLDLAQGNVDLAKSYITQDYQRGIRYAQEDTQRTSGRTMEDFTSAMKSLGLEQLTQEQNLADTLNKRGIALVQQPGAGGKATAATPMQFDETGAPIYGTGGGYAGVERGKLAQDFTLRREALTRTKNRSLEDVTRGLSRTTEELGTQKERGLTQQDLQLRDTQLQLQQEREQKAFQAGTMAQQQQIAQQQMDIQKQQLAKLS